MRALTDVLSLARLGERVAVIGMDEARALDFTTSVLDACVPVATEMKARKLAALAKLTEKPKQLVKVPVQLESGREVLVDLGDFWAKIRRNFGPDPSSASMKLSDEEKAPLSALEWVKKEAQKMVTKASAAPAVSVTRTDKLAALAKLTKKRQHHAKGNREGVALGSGMGAGGGGGDCDGGGGRDQGGKAGGAGEAE